jgi:hypothetical protein
MIVLFVIIIVIKVAIGARLLYGAFQQAPKSFPRLILFSQAFLFFIDALILVLALSYLTTHTVTISL